MAALNTDNLIKGAPIWQGTIGSAGVLDELETTIILSDAAGLPTDTAVELTIDRVNSLGVLTPDLKEVVRGVVSGDSIVNCVRGVEGTAQAHTPSALVECRLTSDQWNRLITHLLVEHNQDGTHKGAITMLTAGEDITAGHTVYIKSDGKVWETDADAIATMPVMGVAISDISNGSTGVILMNGIYTNVIYSFTPGQILYASGTKGLLTATQPTAVDSIIQTIGIAITATKILVNPALTYVTHI